jgi:hypothetical protein
MNIGLKLGLTAVLSVILAGVSAVFIPQPYGIILATLIGLGGGIYMRSLFKPLK